MRGVPPGDGPDLSSLALIALILVLVAIALIEVDPQIAPLFRLGR
jgi:hypothetical protein